jgi:hypothetical protein
VYEDMGITASQGKASEGNSGFEDDGNGAEGA